MSYIILETGFQSIYSDVLYNKEKSFNLLKSGHEINVKEVKSFKTNSIIFGNVIRQTSVTSTPYKVKIE
ncbi:zinc finger MYM-type protein 1-like, partial [Aphis craccivora]